MAYVNYSQVLKGAAYMNIAGELEVHAGEELKHALKLSYWIDLLGGMPAVTAKPVKTSEKATDMLRFDLENEKETIRNYRRRVKQADALDEFALSEDLRDILRDERTTSTPSPPPSEKTPPTPASPTDYRCRVPRHRTAPSCDEREPQPLTRHAKPRTSCTHSSQRTG